MGDENRARGDDVPAHIQEARDRLRRSRTVAWIGWLALLTAAWLPWWSVTVRRSDGVELGTAVHLFLSEDLVRGGMTVLTGILVAAAALVVFVRLAGSSWRHEPPAWRRDLWVAAAVVAAALLSAFFWPAATQGPAEGPDFFDRYTIEGGNDVPGQEVRALPGLGWWLAVAAAATLAAAAWVARPPRDRGTRAG